MGIKIEFNPDLALRNINEWKTGRREQEECIPENLEEGKIYNFLKKDQRNYWFFGELPLIETEGNEKLSRPIASVRIIEETHFLRNDEIYTKGQYQVKKMFTDDKIYFEGTDLVGRRYELKRRKQ